MTSSAEECLSWDSLTAEMRAALHRELSLCVFDWASTRQLRDVYGRKPVVGNLEMNPLAMQPCQMFPAFFVLLVRSTFTFYFPRKQHKSITADAATVE